RKSRKQSRETREAGLFELADRELVEDVTIGLLRGAGLPSLLYERPAFTGDLRVFGDLAAHAPGLSTTLADREAVLEAESTPEAAVRFGAIDPAAQALIDKARSAGWQTVTLPAHGSTPSVQIVCNGAGQYAFERTVGLGLREVVVCDGTTLYHLYPEIGLAARRNVSRFHRGELAGSVPWFLPPADHLVRGADVKCLD